MVNDLASRCKILLQCNSYGANEHFCSTFSWQSQKLGHILVNDCSNENAILAVVGEVLKKGLQCSASGNFHMHDFETLEKAEFQLVLGKPNKTIFANDFDATIAKLTSFQADTAQSPNRENLIVIDGRQKTLHFTQNVFEERDHSNDGKVTCFLPNIVLTYWCFLALLDPADPNVHRTSPPPRTFAVVVHLKSSHVLPSIKASFHVAE